MESDAALSETLRDLECALHRREVRNSAGRLCELLAEDFVEFGVSGTVWTRAAIIAALREETPAECHVDDFAVRRLGDDTVLVTYRAHRVANAQRPAADSLRSSIWRFAGQRWQMIFHQGTAL